MYFENLGFVCPKGANVADFLTSVTVETERVVAAGHEGRVPTTPQQFEDLYQQSDVCRQMRELIQPPEALDIQVDDLKMAVAREKRQRKLNTGSRGVYTAGLREQIKNCTIRYVLMMLHHRPTS